MSLPSPVRDGVGLLPNTISALRFPLAVAFVLAATVPSRLAIAALAALSDWVDGRLARSTGSTSRLGELLDPLADRTFVITAFVTLAVEGRIPWWTLPLLLLRDAFITIGALSLLGRRREARFPARTMGKGVTMLQLVALLALIVRPALAPLLAPPIALLGVLALLDYRRTYGTRPT